MRGLVRVGKVILLILWAQMAVAQEYNIRTFTVKQGLGQNTVRTLFEDRNGHLWVGTWGGGICVFNGYDFQKIDTIETLVNASVMDVFEDNSDNLWFATYRGAWRYDGSSFASVNDVYHVKPGQINDIDQNDNGQIVLLGRDNLYFLEEEGYKIIQFPDGVLGRAMAFHGGELMVATNKGLYHLEGKRLKKVYQGSKLDGNVLNCILSHNGQLWVGTNERMYQIDRSGVIVDYAEKLGLPDLHYERIRAAREGGFLISTRDGFFKTKNQKIQLQLGVVQGLKSARIHASLEDKDGNLWLGTYDGLSHYTGKMFTYYSERSGLAVNSVFSIFKDREGRLWIGNTNGAINVLETDGSINTHHFPRLKNVQKISQDEDGKIWMAINKFGLIEVTNYDKGNLQYNLYNDQHGLLNSSIFGFQFMGDEVLCWGENGCYILDRKKPGRFRVIGRKDGLDEAAYYMGYVDRYNSLWLAGWGSGLARVTRENGKVKKVKNYSMVHRSIGFHPLTVVDRNDTLFVASHGQGITAFHIDGDKSFHLGKENGLISNTIYAHYVDESNLHWAGSENGFQTFRLNEKHEITDSRFYTYEDGFFGVELNHNGIMRDERGRMYFGTVGNLTIFDPSLDVTNKTPANLNIRNIRLYYQDVNWKDYMHEVKPWKDVPDTLELAHNDNHLSIDFEAISLEKSEKIFYKWKLDGFDEDWVPPTKSRTAVYSNLPPGDYVFQLLATNSEGIWNEEVLEYQIRIYPPFYLTWWFLLLSFASATGVFVLIVRLRIRSLKVQKEKLEEMVMQRTSELRNEKEEVVRQKQLVDKEKEEVLRHQELLKQKNELITDSINYAKRIQEAILPDVHDIRGHFQDSFIYFRPKDIVSGDYYWFHQQDDKVVIAAVDCTGHGVPGAFMSIITSNLLDQVVQNGELGHPSQILDRVNQQLPSKIQMKYGVEDEQGIQDGMDIALCCIDLENNVLKFAGAHNPAYIIREEELIVLSGDKIHIGMDQRYQAKSFTRHDFQLQSGDLIYVFSDGYHDQVGGERRKRFRASQFRELLLRIRNLPMKEQQAELDRVIEKYRGNNEQLDDILIIGLKVK